MPKHHKPPKILKREGAEGLSWLKEEIRRRKEAKKSEENKEFEEAKKAFESGFSGVIPELDELGIAEYTQIRAGPDEKVKWHPATVVKREERDGKIVWTFYYDTAKGRPVIQVSVDPKTGKKMVIRQDRD